MLTRREAEEILDEAGRLLQAAEMHYESVELDAADRRRRIGAAWRDWDLDTLVELEILTEAEADDVGLALNRLEE